MYVPLPRFLLRAPLLPIAALPRARRSLLAHPLGAQAIANASPSLASARPGAKRDRALDRYARRAAFRPTPAGLLAGVCMGRLGRNTAVASGSPRAYVTPSWARIDALARGLLDDPEIRERTRLRVSPSAMWGANVVRWICPAEPFAEEGEAGLDGRLSKVLGAAGEWTAWTVVREAARGIEDEDEDEDGVGVGVGDGDDFLLTLVDAGLLQSDLAPPLVGARAVEHLRARLEELGRIDAVEGELEARSNDHAVLVHRPRKEPTLERAAVERAARLVPLLIGIQEALAGPAAERFNQQGTADALDAITESFGSGAFDLSALAAGDYGVQVGDGDGEAVAATHPPAAVIGVFFDAIAEAIASGSGEARLDAQRLAAAIPVPGVLNSPPTAELFVVPARPRPRTPPGTGWLLGLHAPAGASFGRFAHALGPAMAAALTELDAAEREAHGETEPVDVAFAPSPALADICTHPRLRRRTLALTRWGMDSDLAPRDLELVADPAAPDALALRDRKGRGPIVPAPLSRVRSAAAAAGVSRLLVGWSLQRQYAPWALPPGSFGDVAFLPRVTLDGFVIAPASWRVPEQTTPRALATWRRTLRVPRVVQIGDGDELLPVDLASPEAGRALTGRARVFEIWPPLDDVVDRDGRRIEAVVMLVDKPDAVAAAALARHAAAVRAAEPVPPPHRAPPAPAWRTFKLFGAEAFQDELLLDAAVPAVQAALRAGEIDAWFFLRYIDGPGRRPHLRLRVRSPSDPSPFERRLTATLEPARARATLTTVETADYHPERGRFLPGELDAVHAIFEADSDFACLLLADRRSDDALERITFAVRAFDALAEGMGLPPEARETLARSRRDVAGQPADQPANQEERLGADLAFRACSNTLQAALGVPGEQVERITRAADGLSGQARRRLLPDLLHLSAVRLLGPDRNGEHLAYVFWERTLEGLRKRARSP